MTAPSTPFLVDAPDQLFVIHPQVYHWSMAHQNGHVDDRVKISSFLFQTESR